MTEQAGNGRDSSKKTGFANVKIFDTTLRDGEQSPGMSMNLKEKIEMAKQLERMGVDIIEAGFAISSPGDFISVKTIAETLKDCTVASLARASIEDIDRAWEAVRDAADPRIHLFLATSPLHMEYKLHLTPDKVYEQATAMTAYAKKYCANVEFSAEDATRSDIGFLAKVVEGVIAAGATTVNLPDTVGYTTPEENYRFFLDIRERAPSLNGVVISTHCHNDLGLGVANSLAAIRAGVTQVECTINGIGERAGNAAMEEIVMALYVRKEEYRAETNIITSEITRSSNLLTRITGVKVQPNKAITGENAFAHEAGIHQHGVMQNPLTYEIMTPASVGLKESNLVLGKHSGKHAFGERVKNLGYTLTDAELVTAFEKFKVLADKKKQVYDKDIEAIVAKETVQVPKTFTLKNFVINSGNAITSTAVITLMRDGNRIERVSGGDGPLDAAFKAIDKIIGMDLNLEDYQLNAVTEGEDAMGDALVIIRNKEGAGDDGNVYSGRGLSTDIVEASIYAYINAVNKMYYAEGRR
ncbi:MAG: 2-isopropylmalate synthase [Clostridiales Family XIII bacterium]|jgi:2-isopropylmalate synthase|nr:2-isopropylmalate synthase [Clostridiales Family XIII bacterium]